MGFETRNKYGLSDVAGHYLGYAAEQNKGFLGFIFRQMLGHWRRFDIYVFNVKRETALRLVHPFRWFFQRVEVFDATTGVMLGAIQQRFSILSKRFDVEDGRGKVRYEVSSPVWKLWTFSFVKHGREVASVKKKWSGILSEVFTDRDNFMLDFSGDHLDEEDRLLILGAALFIDLQYFEAKAR